MTQVRQVRFIPKASLSDRQRRTADEVIAQAPKKMPGHVKEIGFDGV